MVVVAGPVQAHTGAVIVVTRWRGLQMAAPGWMSRGRVEYRRMPGMPPALGTDQQADSQQSIGGPISPEI